MKYVTNIQYTELIRDLITSNKTYTKTLYKRKIPYKFKYLPFITTTKFFAFLLTKCCTRGKLNSDGSRLAFVVIWLKNWTILPRPSNR